MSRWKWAKLFGDWVNCRARQRFTCEQCHTGLRADVIRMPIQQKPHCFRSRDQAASTRALHQFGDCWSCDVFSTRQFIAFFHYRREFDVDRMVRIDVRPIDMIRNDAALARINTSHHGRAVYHRSTGIRRVMVSKSHAFARQFPERRSILLGHKIRTHPIPHNHYYVALGFCGYHRCGRRADD